MGYILDIEWTRLGNGPDGKDKDTNIEKKKKVTNEIQASDLSHCMDVEYN